MTDFSDDIATKFRDYVVDGDSGSGAYSPSLTDLRETLTTLALADYTIGSVQTFLLAATTAAALTGIGLGTGDTPTFTGATLTNLTVDTNVLVANGATNRVGIGVASPTTGLDVDVAADFSSTVAFGGATTFTALSAYTGASGRVVIGNASVPTVGALAGAESFAIAGTGGAASASIGRWSADAVGSYLTLYKSRSGSIGSHTAVQGGDVLGEVVFGGSTGAAAASGARIAAIAASNASTGSLPTHLALETTPSGSATPTGRVLILSSGQVIISHTAAVAISSITPGVQNHGTSQGLASFGQFLWSNNIDGSVMRLAKSRGSSVGSHVIVQSGDTIGQYGFWASDGTGFVQAAQIHAVVNGTPGTNDMPGALVFSTTADGASSVTERMCLASDGLVSFGDRNTGIQGGIADTLPFVTNGVEGARLDSSSRLIVGHTASVTVGASGSRLQVYSASVHMARYSSDANAFLFNIGKSRSAAAGSNTILANNDAVGILQFLGDDGTAFVSGALISAYVDGTPGVGDMPMRMTLNTRAAGGGSASERVRITSAGVVRPGADNTQTLGDSSFRWSVVYAGTGTINTSDARDKVWRGALNTAEFAVAQRIAAKVGAYQWIDAVDQKGYLGARMHVGVKAQDVKEAFEAEGLDPGRYAVWTNTPLIERKTVNGVDVDAPVMEADGVTQKTRMGLRHDQLALFLLSAGLKAIDEIRDQLAA